MSYLSFLTCLSDFDFYFTKKISFKKVNFIMKPSDILIPQDLENKNVYQKFFIQEFMTA